MKISCVPTRCGRFRAAKRLAGRSPRAAQSRKVYGCVLHADPGYPAIVGDECVIGHKAIVHGCEIEDGCLVGMGAIMLNGARIGERSIVAAGALVPEGKEFPPGSLIVGIPAKRAKEVSEEQTEDIGRGVRTYVKRASSHRESLQRR